MNKTNNSHANQHYSPLYFLASLGAGGLVVTFFMYLLYWVPHPGQPVPVFEDIAAFFGQSGAAGQLMVVLALAGIAVFAVVHYGLLAWNLKQLARFKASADYQRLHNSNAETQLKAVPLTLAMAINVGFIVGLAFVPGLWSVVEYLFPFAMLAFLAVGVFSLRLLARFFGRLLSGGGFDPRANNSFAQLLPAFALSMVAVGLAAPAAMSSTVLVVGISQILATFFVVAAVLVTVIALVIAVMPMLEQGTAPEAAPTLMVVVPIVTVLGIAMLRLDHGMHTQFGSHAPDGETLVFLTRLLSVQVLFTLLGALVLRRQRYARQFLARNGTRSAGSYALVCPGVALSVMWQFWVNKGLVAAGMVEQFSVAYWLLTTPAIAAQIAMIVLVVHLHRLHFTRRTAISGQAAMA